WIHDNYIHHNQHPTAETVWPFGGGHGEGYGVQISRDGYALIEQNVFEWNRHDIAGDDGSSGSGYLAYRNLILPEGHIGSRHTGLVIHTHALDMHGQNTCTFLGIPYEGDHNCGRAGQYVDIEYNTIYYNQGNGVHLRGTPGIQMDVKHN